ncbi:MAG TPA: FAD:protein FMN transferase [Gaiellales bacterium]
MTRRTLCFEALGTTALVTVADPARLREAGALLHDELAVIDQACSRFRPDSELNAVNAGAGSPVGVSSVLYEAVAAALRAAAATDGAVDLTVGASVRSLGYDCDFALIATDDGRRRVVRLRRSATWRKVLLDAERHTIRVPRGVELDLGATGKAFAADRAARRIANETSTGVLVSLGGDIAVAGAAPSGGWPVRVSDDHRDRDGDGPTISLRTGGLATSSTTVRRWRAGGAEHHHIVDPRTGRSAPEIWRTASVAAATCVDANAASTAAIVLGEAAPAWLERTGLAARLVARDGEVVGIAGWPHD